MQARDVALEVVEAVAAGATGSVQIDAVQLLHDVHMIGHLEVRHKRLAEALNLDVLGVILADGHILGRHIRNGQQNSLQAFFNFLQRFVVLGNFIA